MFRGDSLADNAVDLEADFDPSLQATNQLDSLRRRKAGLVELISEVLTKTPDLNQTEVVDAVRALASKQGQELPGKNGIRFLLKALTGHVWEAAASPSDHNATRYRLISGATVLQSAAPGTTKQPPRETENQGSQVSP